MAKHAHIDLNVWRPCSCLDCGAIVAAVVYRGEANVTINDVPHVFFGDLPPEWEISQGLGVSNGGKHRCTPTVAALFEVDGLVELMEVAS